MLHFKGKEEWIHLNWYLSPFSLNATLKGKDFFFFFFFRLKVTWPRGYKKFFMLNSAEHENFSANKYENAN